MEIGFNVQNDKAILYFLKNRGDQKLKLYFREECQQNIERKIEREYHHFVNTRAIIN